MTTWGDEYNAVWRRWLNSYGLPKNQVEIFMRETKLRDFFFEVMALYEARELKKQHD